MKNDLILYVPTYRRIDRQLTLKSLPIPWLNRTVIVCPVDEEKVLGRLFPKVMKIIGLSTDKYPHVPAKRSWILQTTPFSRIMMLDDDLKFSFRNHVHMSYGGYQQGDPEKWHGIVEKDRTYGRIHDATPVQIDYMMQKIEKMLDDYRHGGISQRFMNHTKGHEFILNHKATHALAYHVPTVLDNCKLGRVRMFEDLDYTLQLLRKGYENAIYQWGATNDPNGFNAPGGESGNRKMSDIAHGADLMAKLHPGIVRVVERFGPDAQRLGPKRIVVAWKKAIEEGRIYYDET